MSYNRKQIPESILVFGASDHMGGPLAEYVTREAPTVKLRLATSSETKAQALRERFPAAEVVIANYMDLPSLTAAVAGMEGMFVVTPGGMPEEVPMSNLVRACKASGSLIHMMRIVGLQPEANPRRIPEKMRRAGHGIEIQHPIARKILDDAELPVTYLNCGATFMDNFVRLGLGVSVRSQRKLIWPERLIPWINPAEVGEVAARLLLSDNHRHIGQFHTLNNGHDLLRFHEVAALMSDLYGMQIDYDSSKEAFLAQYAPFMGPVAEHVWDFLAYEQDNEVVWAPNTFVERTLGRKPTTLREWLIRHRDAVLGTAA